MRTGLSFARGSCRALKWMALFGVVFAVGAGSASAQVTISDPKTVDEGESLAFTVTVKYSQAVSATANTVVVAATGAAGTSSAIDIVGRVNGLTAAETTDYTSPLTPTTFNIPAGPTTGTTPKTGTLTQQVYLLTAPDLDAEDEEIEVTFTVTNAGGIDGQNGVDLAAPSDATRTVRVEDDEEQTFALTTPSSPKEGTAATLTLSAVPAPDNMEWDVGLALNEVGYRLATGNAELEDSTPTHSITITPPNNDGNREADTVELSAFVAGTNNPPPGLEDPLEITFADVHALPAASKITAKAYQDQEGTATGRTTTEAESVTEGGEPVHVRVTIDRGSNGYPDDEMIIVSARPASAAQAADYRLDRNSIDIATGNGKKSADFVLTALADNDVGAETLEFELVARGAKAANGAGEVMSTFSIAIVDVTQPMVAPVAQAEAEAAVMAAMGDGPLNPGGSFTVDTTKLFNWNPAAVDVAFGASVSGAAASVSTSGETVTVDAKEAGEAMVTVTATATAKASSAVSTSQTVSNSARVTFDVRVVLADLQITLSGPEDMNIVEGGQPGTVMAKANRPVTKDTTVRLVATGGSASPSDYEVENIMIKAGADEGSTGLMAKADDEGERYETLTLQGEFVDDESGKDGETNTLMFNIWDAAVPALPVVAQLLLAAFLAVGGYRRYLRRR